MFLYVKYFIKVQLLNKKGLLQGLAKINIEVLLYTIYKQDISRGSFFPISYKIVVSRFLTILQISFQKNTLQNKK